VRRTGSRNAESVRSLVAVVLATALAALVSFLFIGKHSLWLDEAVSAQLARLPWAAFTDVVMGREANSAAYFVLLRGWAWVGGTDEAWLRALSAVAFVATVPGVYLLGERLFGHRSGVTAALLFAVSPAAVAAAQEARGFALESFLLVYAALNFLAVRRDSGMPRYAAWVVLSAVAAWVHLLAVLVPTAWVLGYLITSARKSERRVERRVLVGLVCIYALTVPVVYLGFHGGQGGLGFLQGQTVAYLRAFPGYLAGGSEVLLVATLLAAVTSLVVMHRQRSSGADWSVGVVFVLAWLVVPVVLAVAVTPVRAVFQPRYFAYLVVPLVLGISFSARYLRRSTLWPAVVVLMAISLWAVTDIYQRPAKADWRAATQLVVEQSSSSDGLIFAPSYMHLPFEYYVAELDRHGQLPATRLIPAPQTGPLPFEDHPVVEQAVADPATLFHARQRVWVLTSGSASSPDASAAARYLADNAELALERTFSGVRVQRFDLPG
jgi:mannosyltransferase